MNNFCLDQLWKFVEFGEKVFRYDDDGIFLLTRVDDNLCKMLGYSRSELMIRCHNRAKDLIYPPDLPALREHARKELEEKGEYTARYRMRRRDGELIWAWESGVIEYDLSGNRYIHNLVVNISDIENTRKDRDITYDNLPGGVLRMLITKNNFYIMEFNQQYLDMMGTTPDEYMGSSGLYTFPEDIKPLRDHVTLRAENQEPIDFEFRCRCGKEEDVHWFRLVGRFYEEAEDGCEYLCIMLDITKRKRSEQQLEKERTRYQMGMRMVAGVLFEYDAKTQHLQVYNDAVNGAYIPQIQDGQFADLDQILFREDFLHPDDFERLRQYIQSDLDYGVNVRLMAENRKTGERSFQYFEIEITKTWKHGKLRYVTGSIRHIGDREKEKSVRWKLSNLLEVQSVRMYEKIYCVDIQTGEVQIFISENMLFHEYCLEYPYDEYIKELAEKRVHPKEKLRFLRLMKLDNMCQVLQSGQMEEVLFFRIRNSEREEYRYKCIRYTYLEDDAGTIFINVQDVHQIREEQLKIENANRKILASALNEGRVTMEMRRNFATMIARELYAPLRFVEREIHEKEKEYSGNLKDAILYMGRVIDNIAQYEKLERGKIRFENKLFELDEVLLDVFRGWKKRLGQTNMKLVYRLELTWKYYYGDPVHLTQCMNHIIGNCVMVSEGKGTIDIWGSDEDQGNGISHLCLVVEDTGIPINENFFGRDYPMDNLEEQSEWKAGSSHMETYFSLIVARKMIELQGGTIHLTRKEDTRNVLEITLPLQRSQNLKEKARAVTTLEEVEQEVNLSGYTFLVVEARQFVGGSLKLCGAQVDTARNGGEGIQLWLGYSPCYFDAVIVEGELPDMDYLRFTELLRRQERKDASFIPVFAIADGVDQERIREGICRGVNAVFGSSLDLARLEQVLNVLAKSKKKI